MKKVFNTADKVFGKVKGYPAWPAIVQGFNGKKYSVSFYGTGEVAQLKPEDIFYYLKNKSKFYRTNMKRTDYYAAIEAIEKAIGDAGGTDGDPDSETLDSSINVSVASPDLDVSKSQEVTSTKGAPKTRKRKHSSSPSKTTSETKESEAENDAAKSTEAAGPNILEKDNVKSAAVEDEVETTPKPEKMPKREKPEIKSKDTKDISSKAITSEPSSKSKPAETLEITLCAEVDDKVLEKSIDQSPSKTVTKTLQKEDTPVKSKKEKLTNSKITVDKIDNKPEPENPKKKVTNEPMSLISEDELDALIAYSDFVKKHAQRFKALPGEPRTFKKNEVVPIIFPTGKCGGIRFFKEPYPILKTEYERALYDANLAKDALALKLAYLDGIKEKQDSNRYIEDLQLSEKDVKIVAEEALLQLKKNQLKALEIEDKLLQLDAQIKMSLGLHQADPATAVNLLKDMASLQVNELMLKKHIHVVDMLRRLRKYIGNTEKWNMSSDELKTFNTQAKMVRERAVVVYDSFKSVFLKPKSSSSFWDQYNEDVAKFNEETSSLSENEILVLTSEPFSRQTFMNNYFEMKEKDSDK